MLHIIYINWYFYWWWNINPAALGLQQTVEFTGCNVKELSLVGCSVVVGQSRGNNNNEMNEFVIYLNWSVVP